MATRADGRQWGDAPSRDERAGSGSYLGDSPEALKGRESTTRRLATAAEKDVDNLVDDFLAVGRGRPEAPKEPPVTPVRPRGKGRRPQRPASAPGTRRAVPPRRKKTWVQSTDRYRLAGQISTYGVPLDRTRVERSVRDHYDEAMEQAAVHLDRVAAQGDCVLVRYEERDEPRAPGFQTNFIERQYGYEGVAGAGPQVEEEGGRGPPRRRRASVKIHPLVRTPDWQTAAYRQTAEKYAKHYDQLYPWDKGNFRGRGQHGEPRRPQSAAGARGGRGRPGSSAGTRRPRPMSATVRPRGPSPRRYSLVAEDGSDTGATAACSRSPPPPAGTARHVALQQEFTKARAAADLLAQSVFSRYHRAPSRPSSRARAAEPVFMPPHHHPVDTWSLRENLGLFPEAPAEPAFRRVTFTGAAGHQHPRAAEGGNWLYSPIFFNEQRLGYKEMLKVHEELVKEMLQLFMRLKSRQPRALVSIHERATYFLHCLRLELMCPKEALDNYEFHDNVRMAGLRRSHFRKTGKRGRPPPARAEVIELLTTTQDLVRARAFILRYVLPLYSRLVEQTEEKASRNPRVAAKRREKIAKCEGELGKATRKFGRMVPWDVAEFWIGPQNFFPLQEPS